MSNAPLARAPAPPLHAHRSERIVCMRQRGLDGSRLAAVQGGNSERAVSPMKLNQQRSPLWVDRSASLAGCSPAACRGDSARVFAFRRNLMRRSRTSRGGACKHSPIPRRRLARIAKTKLAVARLTHCRASAPFAPGCFTDAIQTRKACSADRLRIMP